MVKAMDLRVLIGRGALCLVLAAGALFLLPSCSSDGQEKSAENSSQADEAAVEEVPEQQSDEFDAATGTAEENAVEAEPEASLDQEPLDAFSWDELSQMADQIAQAPDEEQALALAQKLGLVAEGADLDGTQKKSITLADGTKTTVQICGFAQDDAEAGGKAGITFIFTDFVGQRPMNESDTNSGGWKSSAMREYLNGEFVAQMPADLQSLVTPVKKYTNNSGETEDYRDVSTTVDVVWLFSTRELGGEVDWPRQSRRSAVLNEEGDQYRLFRNMGVTSENGAYPDFIEKGFPGSDSDSWWTRSPDSSFDDDFNMIYRDGDMLMGAGGASTDHGVVPGFCL